MSDVSDQFVGIITTAAPIVIISIIAKATCGNIEGGPFGYEVCGLIFEADVEAILFLSAVSGLAILLAVMIFVLSYWLSPRVYLNSDYA